MNSKRVLKLRQKYQITNPKDLREKLKLRPGQKLLIYELEGTLHLDRHRSIRELRGIAKGMVWVENDRDHTERNNPGSE
ncbi:MAG: AbrB/MazE/SpoVT family DNA-binding domain-containing protein [Candidatus Acidiferrales bacterium]